MAVSGQYDESKLKLLADSNTHKWKKQKRNSSRSGIENANENKV
jgi:hypothetical protein